MKQNDSKQQADSAEPGLGGNELSRTADVFSVRIQRKKKEQAQQKDASQLEAKHRHRGMLQVLANIRKSMRDIARISLGERFFFDLFVDDIEGWPRITLHLMDRLNSTGSYPFFQVTANDRNNMGNITFHVGTKDISTKLSLQDPSALAKLPALLRKSARQYLDDIEDLILAIEHGDDDQLSAFDKNIEKKIGHVSDRDDHTDSSSKPQISGDLYSDHASHHDPFEKHTSSVDAKDIKGLENISFFKDVSTRNGS